jgi:diguanylate cyclase (GGDEF)-like protein
VSTLAQLGATALLSFAAGRLSAEPRIRRLRRLHRAAAYAANHDRLTGLPNRDLAQRVYASRRHRGVATVVALIDLDDFKTINDTFGHHVGDLVLRAAGSQLTTVAVAHDGLAARLGGDEFLLILPARNAGELVAGVLRALARPINVPADDGLYKVKPRGSAGLATADGIDFTAVVRRADIALYHAKQHPGSHRSYQPGMHMPTTAGRRGRRLRDRHRDQRRTGHGGADGAAP